ncbi:hypothetical protein LWI29_028696 [Acer saccharum]|uniref:Uncharacterized protein n=1 Tax=Acer saccharum TaxID=4024 RepID=A0AA39W975_ACESA|nr:hypothetical protein LWI29_028696 [Acer saccharum]
MVIDGSEHKMNGVTKALGLPVSESTVSPPLIKTDNTTKIPPTQDSLPQKQLKERAQTTGVNIAQTVEAPLQISKPVTRQRWGFWVRVCWAALVVVMVFLGSLGSGDGVSRFVGATTMVFLGFGGFWVAAAAAMVLKIWVCLLNDVCR